MNYRQSLITAAILLLFALVGTAMVAYTYDNTREKIAANERAMLLRKLHRLIPPGSHDNALLQDTLQVQNRTLLGTSEPVTVYRARRSGCHRGRTLRLDSGLYRKVAAGSAIAAVGGEAGRWRL